MKLSNALFLFPALALLASCGSSQSLSKAAVSSFEEESIEIKSSYEEGEIVPLKYTNNTAAFLHVWKEDDPKHDDLASGADLIVGEIIHIGITVYAQDIHVTITNGTKTLYDDDWARAVEIGQDLMFHDEVVLGPVIINIGPAEGEVSAREETSKASLTGEKFTIHINNPYPVVFIQAYEYLEAPFQLIDGNSINGGAEIGMKITNRASFDIQVTITMLEEEVDSFSIAHGEFSGGGVDVVTGDVYVNIAKIEGTDVETYSFTIENETGYEIDPFFGEASYADATEIEEGTYDVNIWNEDKTTPLTITLKVGDTEVGTGAVAAKDCVTYKDVAVNGDVTITVIVAA